MSILKLPVKNPIDQNRLNQLRTAAGSGPVLILPHNSPDPDALASGKALATLFEAAWSIPSRLAYNGLVARAENRAMLEHLVPEWEHIEAITNLEQYSALALVDSQPEAGNNSLPEGCTPQIVIDHHHPLRKALSGVVYVDVRPDVGSTVSLVYQYLEAAGIVPDPVLATAMFYGLQTDTNGLARGATPTDEEVYVKLLAWLDRSLLIGVEQAGLPRDYYRAFSKSLQAARIYGRAIVAYLGDMHRSDLGAEMADVFIRLEDARAALCLGCHGGTLHLSLRTEPMSQDAGLLIQEIVEGLGRAGGHGTMAGGQVPLGGQDTDQLVAEIERRFLAVMGETGEKAQLLSE